MLGSTYKVTFGVHRLFKKKVVLDSAVLIFSSVAVCLMITLLKRQAVQVAWICFLVLHLLR